MAGMIDTINLRSHKSLIRYPNDANKQMMNENSAARVMSPDMAIVMVTAFNTKMGQKYVYAVECGVQISSGF